MLYLDSTPTEGSLDPRWQGRPRHIPSQNPKRVKRGAWTKGTTANLPSLLPPLEHAQWHRPHEAHAYRPPVRRRGDGTGPNSYSTGEVKEKRSRICHINEPGSDPRASNHPLRDKAT